MTAYSIYTESSLADFARLIDKYRSGDDVAPFTHRITTGDADIHMGLKPTDESDVPGYPVYRPLCRLVMDVYEQDGNTHARSMPPLAREALRTLWPLLRRPVAFSISTGSGPLLTPDAL